MGGYELEKSLQYVLGNFDCVKHLPARSCSCFRINDQTETTKNNILKDDLVSVFQIFLYNNL